MTYHMARTCSWLLTATALGLFLSLAGCAEPGAATAEIPGYQAAEQQPASPVSATGTGGSGSLPVEEPAAKSTLEKATFGSGCFWCTEAIFERLQGVKSAVSGYSGGSVENPTYEQVCSETTGHAEVVQVTFDPQVITYPELLEVFWQTHDPTTLNRQGNDVGTQYRSVVFYHSPEQQQIAEQYKQQLDESGAYRGKIVTEISPYRNFFKAENYHQDYFRLNGRNPYCAAVIQPKIEKFQKQFKDKLAPSSAAGSK